MGACTTRARLPVSARSFPAPAGLPVHRWRCPCLNGNAVKRLAVCPSAWHWPRCSARKSSDQINHSPVIKRLIQLLSYLFSRPTCQHHPCQVVAAAVVLNKEGKKAGDAIGEGPCRGQQHTTVAAAAGTRCRCYCQWSSALPPLSLRLHCRRRCHAAAVGSAQGNLEVSGASIAVLPLPLPLQPVLQTCARVFHPIFWLFLFCRG